MDKSPSLDRATYSHAQTPLVPQKQEDNTGQQVSTGEHLSGTSLSLRNIKGVELSDNAGEKIGTLFGLVSQRLQIMPEVAAVKEKLGQDIFDKGREAIVLESALKIADDIGLKRPLAEKFVRAQMEAAKVLQRRSNEVSGLSKEQAAEKKEQLREQITALNKPILEALKAIQDDIHLPTFQREIERQLNQLEGSFPFSNGTVRQVIRDSLKPTE